MQSSAILQQARQKYTQADLAKLLEVSARTISRWETGATPLTGVRLLALKHIVQQPTSANLSNDFTFVDLFAGIGGMRLGFEANGGQCVFTSEWNSHSQKTYSANFEDDAPIAGDITQLDAATIPDHDVLVAGFPCQPFSIAGVSKKNALGTPHGFECKTQGTLFFDVARIIQEKRPRAFLLENVKNLERHDKGKTFSVILETLKNDLGYHVEYRVIDAKHFVPQHRERIIIVGFESETEFDWSMARLPTIGKSSPTLDAILHPQNSSEESEEPYTTGKKARVNPKYTLTDHLWTYLQNYAAKHKAKGNGFGFGLVGGKDTARTLSARYYKDGSEILINQGKRKNPRRLTPRECARLMGFSDSFQIPVSDTQAYKQFGNSVAVPVVTEVARLMKPHVMWSKEATGSTQSTRQQLLFSDQQQGTKKRRAKVT
jgi:DNA (cytosine-5)-methyltransferase 1